MHIKIVWFECVHWIYQALVKTVMTILAVTLFSKQLYPLQVNGMILCLWTAASNGLVDHPPDYTYQSHAGMIMIGENPGTRRKKCPVPLCQPQTLHGMIQSRTRVSTVRGWRLTSWAMKGLKGGTYTLIKSYRVLNQSSFDTSSPIFSNTHTTYVVSATALFFIKQIYHHNPRNTRKFRYNLRKQARK
jgi:hypothetical protein